LLQNPIWGKGECGEAAKKEETSATEESSSITTTKDLASDLQVGISQVGPGGWKNPATKEKEKLLHGAGFGPPAISPRKDHFEKGNLKGVYKPSECGPRRRVARGGGKGGISCRT